MRTAEEGKDSEEGEDLVQMAVTNSNFRIVLEIPAQEALELPSDATLADIAQAAEEAGGRVLSSRKSPFIPFHFPPGHSFAYFRRPSEEGGGG